MSIKNLFDSKYKITYPIAIIAPSVATFLVLFLGKRANLFYSLCYAASAALLVVLICRVVLHEIDKDNSLRTWQVTVYMAVTLGGWVGSILAKTWRSTSLWMCVMCSGLILTLGARFLKDENADGIPDIFQAKSTWMTEDYCVKHILYKFKDDVLGNDPDEGRPLCIVEGKAVTVEQARKLGYTSVADSGLEYIKSFFK